MIFKTTGGRVEVEYQRGYIFFVRLPLFGEVLWMAGDGWQYWTAREVKAQRAKVERLLGGAASAKRGVVDKKSSSQQHAGPCSSQGGPVYFRQKF